MQASSKAKAYFLFLSAVFLAMPAFASTEISLPYDTVKAVNGIDIYCGSNEDAEDVTADIYLLPGSQMLLGRDTVVSCAPESGPVNCSNIPGSVKCDDSWRNGAFDACYQNFGTSFSYASHQYRTCRSYDGCGNFLNSYEDSQVVAFRDAARGPKFEVARDCKDFTQGIPVLRCSAASDGICVGLSERSLGMHLCYKTLPSGSTTAAACGVVDRSTMLCQCQFRE